MFAGAIGRPRQGQGVETVHALLHGTHHLGDFDVHELILDPALVAVFHHVPDLQREKAQGLEAGLIYREFKYGVVRHAGVEQVDEALLVVVFRVFLSTGEVQDVVFHDLGHAQRNGSNDFRPFFLCHPAVHQAVPIVDQEAGQFADDAEAPLGRNDVVVGLGQVFHGLVCQAPYGGSQHRGHLMAGSLTFLLEPGCAYAYGFDHGRSLFFPYSPVATGREGSRIHSLQEPG